MAKKKKKANKRPAAFRLLRDAADAPGTYRVIVRSHARNVPGFSRTFRADRLPPRDEGGRWEGDGGGLGSAVRKVTTPRVKPRTVQIKGHTRNVHKYDRKYRPSALTDRNQRGEFVIRGSQQRVLFGAQPATQKRRKPAKKKAATRRKRR